MVKMLTACEEGSKTGEGEKKGGTMVDACRQVERRDEETGSD